MTPQIDDSNKKGPSRGMARRRSWRDRKRLAREYGVGPYVVRLLEARYEFDVGVEVADLGTPALDLIDQISGKDGVILIDSIDAEAALGTVLLYHKADLVRHCPAVRVDPYSPALVDTLLGADFFGIAPAEVLLWEFKLVVRGGLHFERVGEIIGGSDDRRSLE
jgi:hydrogenase maturation protease